jgi:3,4-dehydroadipyl-CoA semialdehyde dehydrogenase
MIRLESYVEGKCQKGSGDGRPFVNPTTDEVLGTLDATGIDVRAAFKHAREKGAPALHSLDFAQRSQLLADIANTLTNKRESYGEIAQLNCGNTSADAAIDIDGGIATLKYYARLGKALGSARNILEESDDQLTRAEGFRARHIWSTREGVAVHVNAYNFPSWGLWEKFAVAFLAGMPVIAEPASATAWLAERMVRDVVAANVLPEGALSLICGVHDALLTELRPMDCLAFTGSAKTGRALRGHPRVLQAAPRITIEADSINAAVLMPDVTIDSPIFDIFQTEIVRAVTVKAGQLCTNIRRVLVPAAHFGQVADRISGAVAKIASGDPGVADVKLGPLVNQEQRNSALEGIRALQRESRTVIGGDIPDVVINADPRRGAFLAPTVLAADGAGGLVHEIEVFGPVVSLLPYRSIEDAVALCRNGGGSLAISLYGEDPSAAGTLGVQLAPQHGRILIIDPAVGAGHTGHAIVMPQCVHGGPGRAGGGEELGGLRGLRFYMQRSALQGSTALLNELQALAVRASLEAKPFENIARRPLSSSGRKLRLFGRRQSIVGAVAKAARQLFRGLPQSMSKLSVEIRPKPGCLAHRGQSQHSLATRIEHRRTERVDHGFTAVEGFQPLPRESLLTNLLEALIQIAPFRGCGLTRQDSLRDFLGRKMCGKGQAGRCRGYRQYQPHRKSLAHRSRPRLPMCDRWTVSAPHGERHGLVEFADVIGSGKLTHPAP